MWEGGRPLIYKKAFTPATGYQSISLISNDLLASKG